MSSLLCFVVLAILGSTLAFPGEFIPKSFYTIDQHGHKSDVVYLRKSVIPRFRRSAYPAGGSYDGSIAFEGSSPLRDIADRVESGLGSTFQQLRSLAAQAESGNGGGGYSGSFSGGVGGPGLAGQGTVLHSRFASDGSGHEKEYVSAGGGGIQASANAAGPNGGYSYSSSSVDGDGNVHYTSKARRF